MVGAPAMTDYEALRVHVKSCAVQYADYCAERDRRVADAKATDQRLAVMEGRDLAVLDLEEIYALLYGQANEADE